MTRTNVRQRRWWPASSISDETSDRKETASERVKPQNKQLWATLEGKDTALERLAEQIEKREGSHIKHRVALTDGCKALQKRVLSYCPDFTLILDFIHGNEYLWDAANCLFDEKDPQRVSWAEEQTLQILSGKAEQVIADFRSPAQAPKCTKAQRKELEKAANYFERNLPYMAYDYYLAQGWPIASGVIEGACRHLDRFELSGMRWTQAGAENLLRLRAVAENGDWHEP